MMRPRKGKSMDNQELDRRLAAADPARPTPASLIADVEDFFERPPIRARRHPWRTAGAISGAVLIVGSLAAATNIDEYFLSRPPFSTLNDGETRVLEGLPYTPVGQTDRGEKCEIFVDFAGLTADDIESVNMYWKSADPVAFAVGVNARLDSVPTTDIAHVDAVRAELIEEFASVVPDLSWGTAPPRHPFAPGEPHLTAFSTVCEDDLAALGW